MSKVQVQSMGNPWIEENAKEYLDDLGIYNLKLKQMSLTEQQLQKDIDASNTKLSTLKDPKDLVSLLQGRLYDPENVAPTDPTFQAQPSNNTTALQSAHPSGYITPALPNNDSQSEQYVITKNLDFNDQSFYRQESTMREVLETKDILAEKAVNSEIKQYTVTTSPDREP